MGSAGRGAAAPAEARGRKAGSALPVRPSDVPGDAVCSTKPLHACFVRVLPELKNRNSDKWQRHHGKLAPSLPADAPTAPGEGIYPKWTGGVLPTSAVRPTWDNRERGFPSEGSEAPSPQSPPPDSPLVPNTTAPETRIQESAGCGGAGLDPGPRPGPQRVGRPSGRPQKGSTAPAAPLPPLAPPRPACRHCSLLRSLTREISAGKLSAAVCKHPLAAAACQVPPAPTACRAVGRTSCLAWHRASRRPPTGANRESVPGCAQPCSLPQVPRSCCVPILSRAVSPCHPPQPPPQLLSPHRPGGNPEPLWLEMKGLGRWQIWVELRSPRKEHKCHRALGTGPPSPFKVSPALARKVSALSLCTGADAACLVCDSPGTWDPICLWDPLQGSLQLL